MALQNERINWNKFKFEEIKPEDNYLSAYGVYVKVSPNGHNGHDKPQEKYSILTEEEFADLIELEERRRTPR